MNKTSNLVFIITHLKKKIVVDAFCSMLPLLPSLRIPACASETDTLGFARLKSTNFWLCQFVNYRPDVCK